jgi:hypothetical protein
MVSKEIKGQLAKLLATEDLLIEHRRVSTASFDVERRVLTLPNWDRASSIVYDLLVGHEVGHALFTPNENWRDKVNIPQQFVNVVEDVRIEKLMKRKYPGMVKTFYRGYSELADEDFFAIADEDISQMNLADRANLYFKIGNFIDCSFKTPEEKIIIQEISEAETFDDALSAAETLYQYCKGEKEEQKPNIAPPQGSSEGGGETEQEQQDTPQNQSEDSDSLDSDDKSEEQDDDIAQEDCDMNSEKKDNLDVLTDGSLADKLKDLTSSDYYGDTAYHELPKVNIDYVIGKNEEIHELLNTYFSPQQEFLFSVDEEYSKFKKNSQKEVGFLQKEFECKKAADSYARTTVARTGVLDCTKLHTYKYNDDLFKKVSVTSEGKNHGLVFVLDWSGSMSRVLKDTCKQLFSLIWFCKKSGIPFDVYAFTNEWAKDYDANNSDLPDLYQQKEGDLCVAKDFRMMHLLTHKTKAKELDIQMRNVWRVACSFNNAYYCNYSIPFRLSLSGTPLNESLITLHQILPKFKKENNLQKIQCIVLTDGEAGWMVYHRTINRSPVIRHGVEVTREPFIGTGNVRPDTSFIRDRKLGTTYAISGNTYSGITDALLRNLSDKFTDVNFIGIRLMESRDSGAFINRYVRNYFDKEQFKKEWKKDKSVIIHNSAYNVYFGINSGSLSNDSEFSVDSDASKTQIKKAFAKSLSAKKINKRVLSEFINFIV